MVVYRKASIAGSVRMPPSKSAAHRALICAALSGGRCRVEHIIESDDMRATLGALKALGADPRYDAVVGEVEFSPWAPRKSGEIDCLASGSTLRFLIPVAAALGGRFTFTGRDRLPERPIGVYTDLLPAHGAVLTGPGGLPLTVDGKLLPGDYALPGNVSSQFITGLLLALPFLGEESRVRLTSPLSSAGYVALTRRVQAAFGVEIAPTGDGWRVPASRYVPRDYAVEGDWSQAAFFLLLAALSPNGGAVRLSGLDPESVQGDRACVREFERFGLSVRWDGDDLVAENPRAGEPFGGLTGHEIDAEQIPDLVPALAACGAFARGETRIVNAGRLRLKESDRIAAMEDAVRALGGTARSTPDSLILTGQESLPGGTAQGKRDHRVVMALAAAALRCRDEVRVTDEESIRKSYPGFFEDLRKLGGIADVVHMG